MKTNKKNIMVKKLLYRCKNLGHKETIIIFTKFAKQNLEYLSCLELEEFAMILSQSDADLYDWLVRKLPYPQHFAYTIMNRLITYSKV